jgi:hypothetical protein
MIKEILSKLFTQKPKDLECAIDEDKVDCEHLDDDQDKAYVGVPAPVLNPLDDWFSSSYGCPSVVTEKQKDYMEQETLIKQQQYQETHSVEPANIHQVMYEMATKSGATTVQLDPIGGSENFQGGSENVHR